MKKLSFIVITIFAMSILSCSSTKASMQSSQEGELTNREIKIAEKEAKRLEKEGWKPAPGLLPLQQQIEKSMLFQKQHQQDGLTPKYVWGDATSKSDSYDAGKMQALEIARINLVGNMEMQLTQITRSKIDNGNLDEGQANSAISLVRSVKSIVSKKLGQTIPVIDIYRTLSDGRIEARVVTFYSMNTTKDLTREAVQEQFKNDKKQLEAFDAAFGQE